MSASFKPKKNIEIRVYTRAGCERCVDACRILTERGIAFREIDVTDDYVLRGWLAWALKHRTLPGIIVDGDPIGYYAEIGEDSYAALLRLDAAGDVRRVCVREVVR